MLKRKKFTMVMVVLSLLLLKESPSHADAPSPLLLAEEGQTKYTIVIGQDPDYGEKLASKELAHFLNQMTGADFSVKHDNTPATEFEIVVGQTNRKRGEQIPEELKTDNWEGFTILREDSKLFILGNIPRGTLYGVYDLLDVELGIRFLTAEVTHVPKRPTLKVDIASRKYGPSIERRTIWEGLGGDAMLRNRLNGSGFAVLNADLGGVKVIGPQTHSFDALVPCKQYFAEHPEYYSEIEGVRRSHYEGILTQLCVTNSAVAEIALDTIREWLGPEIKENPYNKYIVSVTVNDSPWFCQCVECKAVNQQEGVKEGATILRFVNTIATQLAEEYPAVGVETMIYGTSIPKTKPVSNVLMQIVKTPDMRFALDDPTSPENREALSEFTRAKTSVGDGGLYNWLHLGSYSATSYLDPRPNLKFLMHNIREMNEHGITGFFSQTVQSRSTEMQDLRFYLLSRAMWRPQLDPRATMEEFCRLFYRESADDVLRFIDFLHDEYGPRDRSKVTPANPTAVYDAEFISQSDEILAAAEAHAQTPEVRQRVATCRLPIWKLKLDRSFGNVGRVFTFPVEWSFKIDPEQIGLENHWPKSTSLADWSTMRIDNHWTAQGEERRGAGWYGIEFEMPETHGVPLALWFGAIDGDADIFLDGVKVGEQKLPATTMWQHGFFIPLNDGLKKGKHLLIVRVFKTNYAAGIWKNDIAIVDMSVPIPDDLRIAGERFLEVARAADLSYLSESYGGRYVQTEKMYYPKIEFFLTHGQ